MALGWSGRRKLLYSAAGAFLATVALFLIYQTFFTNPPSCRNGVQDQDERGVDCGGVCALVCSSDAHAPKVLWSRSFESAPGVYTAATYVQNDNVGAGAYSVPYSFQLFDRDNLLVVERQGVVNLPPVQTIPIIDTGIGVGNRTVARALFSFSATPVWNKIPAERVVPLSITNQSLSPEGTRLSATLVNNTIADARNVTVNAVLFDQDGVARAASKSVLSVIARKSSQGVVFTWPTPTANVVRAEITILPSF